MLSPRRPRALACILGLGLLAGCGDGSGDGAVFDGGPDGGADAGSHADPMDAGELDARGPEDAGPPDLGPEDLGPFETGAPDAGAPDATGFGIITGACGVLDDELTRPVAATFTGSVAFAAGFDPELNRSRLSEGALEILREGTAGGSSGYSEALGFDVLHRCEGAELLYSETEVRYDPESSKKTDMVVRIDGVRIGVSVTRAVGFPRDAAYTVDRAAELLEDKLADIQISSANVEPEFAWTKQILYVVAWAPMHAASLRVAETMIPPEVRGDTLLWITVTNGDDAFIY